MSFICRARPTESALGYISKGVEYQSVPVSLIKGGGEQHFPEFRALNPQGAVPIYSDHDISLSQSLAILAYLRNAFKADTNQRSQWFRHWLLERLDALELWLAAERRMFKYSVSDEISLADICIVPQLYQARRLKLQLDDFPRLCAIEAACLQLEAFSSTAPEP